MLDECEVRLYMIIPSLPYTLGQWNILHIMTHAITCLNSIDCFREILLCIILIEKKQNYVRILVSIKLCVNHYKGYVEGYPS